MKKVKKTWTWGRDPAPTSWHETVDAIKSLKKRAPRPPFAPKPSRPQEKP